MQSNAREDQMRLDEPFTAEEMEAMRRAGREDEARTLRDAFDKARALGKRLPFAQDVLAAYFCVQDPTTPRRVKWILLGALAYFVLPTDLVADFLPVLGFTDDLAVLTAAFGAVATSIRPEHREEARRAIAEG
ncbi:YkvA family protein [Salinarimonas sp. NSM]|uniref:YkvA family protein n=1 Tax=Salinarimonas sp. NSM TaxID=3458003 RepID=UPI0040364F71